MFQLALELHSPLVIPPTPPANRSVQYQTKSHRVRTNTVEKADETLDQCLHGLGFLPYMK